MMTLAMAMALMASACGGDGDSGADGTATADQTVDEESPTSEAEATSTTAETTTTTEATTTAAEATSTASTLSDAEFEQHLADALLTAEDVPDYLAVEFENGLAFGLESQELGDIDVAPCGEDLVEAAAVDARQSVFVLPDGGQFSPQGGFINIFPNVRQVEPGTSSGLVDLFSQAVAGCAGQEVQLDGGRATVSQLLEVPERHGVTAAGVEHNFPDTPDLLGLSYVFEVGELDGLLVMAMAGQDRAFMAAEADEVVARFQERLGACAADTELCSAPL